MNVNTYRLCDLIESVHFNLIYCGLKIFNGGIMLSSSHLPFWSIFLSELLSYTAHII